jgi:hypothetical protein
MKSANSIQEDRELKSEASKEISKLIASKSHSPANTMRTINSMFESASKACHLDRERALIEWLQVCVSTALEFGLDSTVTPPKSTITTRTVLPASPKKKPLIVKEEEDYETDVSWEEEDGERYELIGSSDDDYVPSDNDDDYVPSDNADAYVPSANDDAIVPSKKKPATRKSGTKKTPSPAKTPRKKKNQGQVVPPSPPKASSKEATIPVIKEGAGSKALQKYFLDLESKNIGLTSSRTSALQNGYFARAFFFPSKDSFNVRMIYEIYWYLLLTLKLN